MSAVPQRPAAPPTPEPKNGFGTTSLVLALVGLVFTLTTITAFLALILGGLAVLFAFLGMARTRRGRASNRKMNYFGLGIGVVTFLLGLAGMISFFQSLNELDTRMRDLDKQLRAPAPPAAVRPAPPAAPDDYNPAMTGLPTTALPSSSAEDGAFTHSTGEAPPPRATT